MDEQARGGEQGDKAMGSLMLKLFVVTVIAAAMAHGVQYLLIGESHASMSGGVAAGVAVATLALTRGKG